VVRVEQQRDEKVIYLFSSFLIPSLFYFLKKSLFTRFSISMTNATFSYEADLNMVSNFPSSCEGSTDGQDNVQITRIGFPIEYDDVNFDFEVRFPNSFFFFFLVKFP